MKYAICLLVHTKPDLLEKIIQAVTSDNIEVFVHLDKKCDIKNYSHVKGATFIDNRVKIYWGGRSMIVAMRNLIEYVVNNTKCEYILFISGQDFPVVTPGKYDSYIDPCMNYVEYEKLPKKDWYDGGTYRISHYYLCATSLSIQSKLLIRLQKLLHIKRKYWECGFEIYGGSQWININITTAKYILNNWNTYYKFFKYCNIPDEMIFQTILLNSPLKDTIMNTNYRYLKYKKNALNAEHLTESNIDSILDSKALFCRKISNTESFERMQKRLNEIQSQSK